MAVTTERIKDFFEGSDPQEFIVAIEATYYERDVYLIINDPVKGKYIQRKKIKPFIWVKESGIDALFGGNRALLKRRIREAGIKVRRLTTNDVNGFENDRLGNGYKYIFTGNGTVNDLINFIKSGGSEIYPKSGPRHFISLPPVEQYMIQTGKRLFKGIDDYNDVHRFQFDLETTGLNPKVNRIFQIGFKDNKSLEEIIEIKSETEFELGYNPIDLIKPILREHSSCLNEEELEKLDVLLQGYKFNDRIITKIIENIEDDKNILELLDLNDKINDEKDEKEIEAIELFFDLIDTIKPDIIAGYNSENFDWGFFFTRCEVIGYDIKSIAKTLSKKIPIMRKKATLKLGAETEYFEQTLMWGTNIIDVSHSVRRAQAINSDIKKWGLKYITEFAEANKPNRVYVPGEMIYKTWIDKINKYAFNDENGDWYIINEKNPIKDGYIETTGAYIIQRYLKDDLWETEKIDEIFSQASFLLSKMLPTNYTRTLTMGTATLWRLIMLTWSYENDLAVPETEDKRDFTGGLSRLLEVGRAEDVVKLDYAALYPNIELTHDAFPSLDISGVMKGLLLYIADTRDEYKALKNRYAEEGNSYLESMYDKKQLPLKILANSFFGSLGAPYLFNWGDSNIAEETTCRGRIYLRLMVKHFWEKHGFRPLVGDSVTGRTPIYIKYKESGLIDIVPIQDVFDKNTNGERDFTKKDFLILTKNGWTEIEYVYRHLTDKPIHRVTTRDRFVECTSDHSLFSNGVEKKPTEFMRDDIIDVYDLKLNNHLEMNLDEAWLLGFFVADGSSIYGNRKQKYYSKRKGDYVYHNGKRSEWTLNNQNYDKLLKAKSILDNMFGFNVKIKDYNKSSNVFKLKTHYRKVAEKFSTECYDANRVKKIPTSILNSDTEVKRAFINGFSSGDGWGDSLNDLKNLTQKSQNVMAGINLILKELDIDFTLKLRKDKENIIAFNLGEKYPVNESKSFRKTNTVWTTDNINNPDNYVYDISADGTFIAGVGGIIAHNTDGFNFAVPKDINNFKYIGKGLHRFTEEGKEYVGTEAAVAEFNDLYMKGRMGLDIDEYCRATINFSRKNYADIVVKPNGKEKIKLVGNTIKSKKMPIYIEDFLAKGIIELLEGRGQAFLELYYDTVEDIYNCKVPLVKIASKGRVKLTRKEYIEKCKKVNKAGNPMPRQAHMELMLKHNLNLDLGDTIYYVNTGTVKSHGDIKTIKHKDGTREIQLNCKLIPAKQIEENPDLTTDEYNVLKYIDMFNKRIKPLLVVFDSEIRDNIVINAKKNKKTGELELETRKEFTKQQCKLIAGQPYEAKDQDTYDELMAFEDKELKFWSNVEMEPNNLVDLGISENIWEEMIADYKVRTIEAERIALEKEKEKFNDITQRIEYPDLKLFVKYCETDLNRAIVFLENFYPFLKIEIKPEVGVELISKKLGKNIGYLADILSYMDEAEKRNIFYTTLHANHSGDKYQAWLDHVDSIAEENANVINETLENKSDVTVNEPIKEIIVNNNDDSDDEWNF